MSGSSASPEVLKLEALLAVEPGRLAYLEPISEQALQQLRHQTTDRLFDTSQEGLEAIASAARVIPGPIAAKLTTRFFPPRLGASIATFLAPDKAIDLAKRLPPTYLAEVGIVLDPRRASALLARMPSDVVVAIGRILAARGEYVAMGRFVGHIGDESIVEAVAALSDEAVLRTAFVLEDKGRIDAVVKALPPNRVAGPIRVAKAQGLWNEALELLRHLDEETLRRVDAALDPQLRARLREHAAAAGVELEGLAA